MSNKKQVFNNSNQSQIVVQQHDSQVKPTQQPLIEDDPVISFYGMYKLSDDDNVSKLQLMIYNNDPKPIILTMERIPVQIGNQKWNIFECQYKRINILKFQTKIITTHYGLSYDYYEQYDHFRKITNDQALFIFDMKIINNNNHNFNKKQSGESITERTQQLIYYSAYLLKRKNLPHLDILLKQFEGLFQLIEKVPPSFQQYAQVLESLIHESDDIPQTIEYILQIHSFLPVKLDGLQQLEFLNNQEIIQVGQQLIQNIFDQISDIEQIYDKFRSNRVIKGFIVNYLINKNYGHIDWLDSIVSLKESVPMIVPNLLKHLFEKFLKNSLGLNLEDMKRIQIIIKNIQQNQQISFDVQFKLLLNLSKMADDIDCLFATIEELLNFEQQNKEYGLAVDLSSQENINVLQNILDQFFKEKVKSLENVSIFCKKFYKQNNEVKNIFYQSQISRSIQNEIKYPQNNYYYQQEYKQNKFDFESESELKYLRIIFIEAYDSKLLQNIEFVDIAKNLKSIPFITLYKKLILEKDDIKASQICVTDYIVQQAHQLYGIQKLINFFDPFLMEIQKIHQDHLQQCQDQKIVQDKSQKLQEFENYISDQIFQTFSSKLNSQGQQWINYLYDFSKIQSQNLQNKYKIKMQEVIRDKKQDRKYLENTIQSISNTKKRFQNDQVSNLIISVHMFALNLVDVKPTLNQIIRELIDNSSKDHHWYFLIQNYEQYKDQDIAKHLIQQVSQFGIDILNKKIKIEELLKIKNHTDQQKECFDTYLTLALKYLQPNKLQNKSIREYIDEILLELKNTLDTVDQLKTFFIDILRLDKNQVPLKDFNQITYDYPKKNMNDFLLINQFEQYNKTAQQTQDYRSSTAFRKKLNEQNKKNDNQNESRIEDLLEQCKNAFIEMQNDINEIKTSDFQDLKIKKVIDIFGLEEIDQILNGKEFSEIKELCNMLIQKQKIEKLCQGLTEMSTVFNLNIKDEIKIAENYLDQNKNQIQEMSCQKFKIIHQEILLIWKPIEQESIQKQDQIISTIRSFSLSNQPLIQFIQSCKSEDLEELKDYVNDYDEEGVSTQTIFNLISIHEYVGQIDSLCKNPQTKYIDVVNFIKQNLDDPQFKQLVSISNHCRSQLSTIMELKLTLKSKEEAKKQQIIAIMKQSTFKLISPNKKKGFWTVQLIYEKNNKRSQGFDIEMISELRDRALLIQQQTQEQQYMEQYVNLANSILQILQNLDKLYQNGYPDKKIFESEYVCNNAVFNDFLQEKDKINKLQEEWQKHLTDAYKQNYWLTLMSGRNFWIIEKFIQGKAKNDKKKKAENILMFMNKSSENLPQYQEQVEQNLTPIQRSIQRLNNIGQQLDKIDNITVNSEIKSHEITKQSRISIQEIGEFYFIENQKPLTGILSLYVNSERNFPRADQILFCTENISYQELLSFLYRCVLSPKTELHCLVKPEQLSSDIQDKLIYLTLKILQDHMIQRPFYLGIVTSDSKSYVSKFFSKHSKTKIIKESQILSELQVGAIVKQIDTQTIFVSSKTAGLGKTHYIKEQAKNQKKKVIFFPIAGQINHDEIGKRLYQIELNEPTIVAIQLSYVVNFDILNELLIDIALLRVFQSHNDIFILPKNCSLYIEIQNSFDNLLKKEIFYRNYVNEHDINEFDLNNLTTIPNDDLQFVCNNLLQLKDESILKEEINKDKLKLINKELSISLLNEYFVKKQKDLDQDPNYIQLSIYIKILKTLFKNFLKCYFFTIKGIKDQITDCERYGMSEVAKEFKTIRKNVFEAILKTVSEFTLKSINRNVGEIQNKSIQFIQQFDNNSENKQEEQNNIEGQLKTYNNHQIMLSWESSNHFNVIFVEDGSVLFIYKDPTIIPKSIQKLIYIQANASKQQGQLLQKNILQNKFEIEDLSKFSHNELQSKLQVLKVNSIAYQKIDELSKFSTMELQDILKKLHSIENQKIEDLSKFSDEELKNMIIAKQKTSYVLTTDNFLKMNVIYLRIQSKIPVIIMGETGCGKTSLIKYLCYQIRDEELEIFNIHAGVTQEQIIIKMDEYTKKANDLQDLCDEENLKKNLQKKDNDLGDNVYRDKKNLWVFFDEFNTTENIGLICEMLTERTLLGKEVPQNMRFIAACNPYRLRIGKLRLKENVGIKKQNKKGNMNSLTYSVYPLPENITFYIYDFGKLNDNDTEKYIQQMLRNSYLNVYQFLEEITKILMASHQYFQSNEDSSSVSLRDVSRFIIISEWFNKSFNLKNREYKLVISKELRACILSICHCYYMRISCLQERKIFLEKICKEMQGLQQQINVEQILQILDEEQQDYINRIELQSDIAKNQALIENIFAIIPCILNKIPIFICGKPGCSKSLAISLIFQSLRGKKSKDEFFMQFPELTMVSFQGSDTCTSEGILKAYERANKLNMQDSNILPVLVFDEIGLAELSKNNPLKVLHSLFEIENRKIGFVGISNWRLDASKMNRVVYLARPDPEQDDLEFTAISIYKSICQNDTHQQLIKDLAKAYFQLKNYYKQNLPEYEDFYGLRDFYHLIKQVSRGLKENPRDREEVIRLTKRAVERNFGGKIMAAQKLGEFFSKQNLSQDIYQFQKSEDILELIGENLLDGNSRYLMLICRQDIAQFILEKKIQSFGTQHKVQTVVGSNFEKDLNEEQYGFSSLSDIILYIERGTSIILKDMEHVYSSLYDLFNQNFSVFGDRRYCRIALGAIQNPKCYVHDNFRCIIFMKDNEDILKKADAPFLNRFEKHYVSLESLLNENQKNIVKQIQNWINDLLTLRMKKNDEQIQLQATNLFPNFNKDNLRLIVLDVLQNSKENDDQEIQLKKCKIEMLRFATQDIIILAYISNIDEIEKTFIIQEYQEIHKDDFQNFINSKLELQIIQQPPLYRNKMIAMSYSGPYQQTDEGVLIRSIKDFKSEQELVKTLQRFYASQREKVFIIEIDYQRDKEHINFIKFIVEKVDNEFQKQLNEKQIVVLIHMQRNFNELESSSLSMCNGWEQKIYCNITNSSFQLSDDLMKKNIQTLIFDEQIYSFKEILASSTERCFNKFQYEKIPSEQQEEINDNIFKISEKISKDEQLIAAFKDKIYKYFEKNQDRQDRTIDWRQEICINKEVIAQTINVKEAIKKVIEIQIEKHLTSILYILEKNSAFMSFFTDYEQDHGITIRKIWIHILDGIQIDNVKLIDLSYSNYMRFTPNLKFPFSKLEYEVLNNIQKQQIKYEQSSEIIIEPYEYFINQFNELSKMGPNISEIQTNKTIQKIYFGDIYRLFLIENLKNLEYEPIIDLIVEKIIEKQDQFMKKLKTFLMVQQNLILICEILIIYRNITGIPFQTIQNTFENQFKENENWLNCIGVIFDQFITNIQHNHMNIILENKSSSFQSYAKLYANLASFISLNEVDLKKLPYLKFWNDLILALDLSQEQEKEFLLNCFQMSQNLGQQDQCYLTDNKFFRYLIDYFEKNQPEKSKKFLPQYYSILIELTSDNVQFISENLDKEVFKHGSILLQNLLSKMNIKIQLNEFIEYVSDPDNQVRIDMIIELEPNGYIKEIESFLQKNGIDCKLGVILSDIFIKNYFNYQSYDDGLLQYYNIFISFVRIFNRNDIDERWSPNLQHLIAISFIKSYLDIYMMMMIKKIQNINYNGQSDFIQLNEEEEERMNDIDNIICNSSIGSTLSIYCLKKIKQTFKFSSVQLKNFIKEKIPNYQWPKQFVDNSAGQNFVDHLPIVDFLQDQEVILLNYLSNIIKLNDVDSKAQLKNNLEQEANTEKKIIIGFTFLKGVFLKYLQYDDNKIQNIENLKEFFTKELFKILEEKIGIVYTTLIKQLICNFPRSNLLKLTIELTQEQIHQRIMFCFILILVFSHNQTPSSISGQFFTQDGKFDIKQINQSYLLGQQPDFKHEYLLNLLNNFDSLKNVDFVKYSFSYSKGGTYACGQDGSCDFVYIVLNCGGQVEERNCPWCKRRIGKGEKQHTTFPREGHNNLSDTDAIAYLKKLIKKYENNYQAGYQIVNQPEKIKNQTVDDLNPTTWRLLRIFTHLPIYFMLISEFMTDQQFYMIIAPEQIKSLIFKPKSFLEKHLQNDVQIIFDQISSAGSDCQAPWIYYILEQMIPIFSKQKENLTKLSIRKNVESLIDKGILQPNISKVAQIGQEQKTRLTRKSEIGEKLIQEIWVEEIKESYKYLKLFRLTKDFSFEDMRINFYSNPMNSEQFKILKIIFDKYDDIKRLKLFYPIIDFTTKLMLQCDHMITRMEAREKKIKDFFNDQATIDIDIFDRFLEAWKQLEFDHLQYMCHQLNYRKNYDYNTEIINFLIDDQEKGGGMCMAAAISQLTSIHNSIMNDCVQAYQKQQNSQILVDEVEYPIQKVQQNHLLDINIDNIDLIRSTSLNNIEYGRGEQLFYDYGRIELNMIKEILNKKKLTSDQLQFTQYQLEILSIQGGRSALIIDIRKKYEQKCFQQNFQNEIQNYLKTFDNKSTIEMQKNFKQLHGNLDRFLIFLLNLQAPHEKINQTIGQICQTYEKFKIDERFKDKTILSQVQLFNIVALYELIEIKIFPHIESSLNTKFMVEYEDEEIQKKLKFLLDSKEKNIPSRKQIEIAIMRFIIRCLVADLNDKSPLKQYIVREDFWDENIELQQFKDTFPEQILLDKTYHTYKIIRDLNQTAEKSQQMNNPAKPQIKSQIKQQANRQNIKSVKQSGFI